MAEPATTRKAVWFYDLQLALLADGGYHLSVATTSVDEEEPELLYQELLSEHVPSIDDALAKLKLILTTTT
jgi:hypothetical protein